MADYIYLIKYDEIGIKGSNRRMFEDRLHHNILAALKAAGSEGQVKRTRGRFYVHSGDAALADVLRRVPGIASFATAWSVKKEKEFYIRQKDVISTILSKAGLKSDCTFKVEARREDKYFPLDSMEINRFFGEQILNDFPNIRVDVHHPDIVINVEVRDSIFIYGSRVPGPGGLPVGSVGKSLLLLSGGIDSPVAGVRIAVRGVNVQGLHFHSYPYTSEEAKLKVVDLACKIRNYNPYFKLYFHDFAALQKKILKSVEPRYFTVIMRRVMLMIAEAFAGSKDIGSLATGESLGQVSSQTMESINCTNRSVGLPVFRPLLAQNKIEITEMARDYDTFDISIRPYEDCCTIFNPPNPATRPKLEAVLKSEARIDDLKSEIERAASEINEVDYLNYRIG